MLSLQHSILHLHLLLLLLARSTSCARIEDLIEPTSESNASPTDSNSSSGLVWQPLRATFRPLNRQSTGGPPVPPPPPNPPFVPFSPPSEPLNSASTTNFDSAFSESRSFGPASPFQPTLAPVTTTVTAAPAPSTTPAPAARSDDPNDEDQPTRVPLNRFRPTKPPSVDPQSQPSPVNLFAASGSQNSTNSNLFGSSSTTLERAGGGGGGGPYRITNECFECICEASTNCNPNSRCQTSDVRHTRCGMMLISYDQWLETGLSRQLVSREALARDAAADERAFYECVTDRECAERLMAIYMQKSARDCDKDGRVDCYDVAAIHQGGVDQCNSESLLDSQYWSDFNACFGFGR